MRRSARPTLLCLVIVVASSAGYAQPGEASGTILLPGSSADLARCAWLTGGEDSQGVVGYVIPITEQQADGLHAYTLSTTTASALAAHFYDRLGTCSGGERWIGGSDQATSDAPASGLIPFGTTHVVIVVVTGVTFDCLYTPPFCPETTVSEVPASFALSVAPGLA